jgi:colanic acid/amylovoran biosynthesis glycosyltransferase
MSKPLTFSCSSDIKARLAVIVTEFPKTTETFIMRDVIGFNARGYEVRLYHLTPFNKGEVIHEFARPALGWARNVPYFSQGVLIASLRWLRTKPRAVVTIIREIFWGCRGDLLMLLKSLFILPKSLAIATELQDWQAGHVHAAYAGHPATCAWIIRRVTGIPYSVSSHAHDIFETQALLDIKLREADFVRTVSRFNRDYLVRRLPFLQTKPPTVIHVGALLDSIAPLPPPVPEPFQVLYVGSLEHRKGVDVLLHALAIAKLDDWRARIIGHGPERRRLERLAKKLGLAERITFCGPQTFEVVRQSIADCSVLVVPSRIGPRNQTEGLPTIIVEALAHQRPVIASRLTGIPEIILDGETGFLADVDDVSGFVRALEDVQRNSDVAYERAVRGRRLVEAEFDQSRSIAALTALIDDSVARNLHESPEHRFGMAQ